MHTPIVTIITRYTRDDSAFLATVDAVLRQSLQRWEWLIVATVPARALDTLRGAAGQIRVLDMPSQPDTDALLVALEASSAPLVCLLDQGTLLVPTALETLAWALLTRDDFAFATCSPARPDTLSPAAPLLVRRSAIGSYSDLPGLLVSEQRIDHRQEDQGRKAKDEGQTEPQNRRTAEPQNRRIAEPPTDWSSVIRRPSSVVPARQALRGGLLDVYAPIVDAPPFDNLLPARGQRRVLLLMPWMRVGGSERFALDLIGGLAARGDSVSVCLLRGDAEHTWMDELRKLCDDVFDLPAFLAPADYPRFLRYLAASRRVTHVFVSQSLLAYQLLAFLRAHYPEAAYVDYLHIEEPWRSGGLPRASLDHDALLDLHIVSSAHLRGWLIDRGGDPARIEVCTTNSIPPGWRATPELRTAARARRGLPDDTPVILFAGRLVAQKRPRLAAMILQRAQQEGMRFVCFVAGDGQDAGWLRRFVWRHGLGRQVRLLGAVPREQLRELMLAADVLLLPSDNEGIALVLFEAMAMGLVPLAAHVGGQRELVTPDCGVLIAPGPDELELYVAALRRLLEDPRRRKTMAAAAQTRVWQHFAPAQMLDRMQQLLDEATRRAHATPRPPIAPGVGHAVAALAIEHAQLDARLRALPPVRMVLALRQSSAWPLVGRLAALARRL